jgi:hypothetical protein
MGAVGAVEREEAGEEEQFACKEDPDAEACGVRLSFQVLKVFEMVCLGFTHDSLACPVSV